MRVLACGYEGSNVCQAKPPLRGRWAEREKNVDMIFEVCRWKRGGASCSVYVGGREEKNGIHMEAYLCNEDGWH